MTGWRVAVVCLALGFAFTGPLLVYRFLDATQTTVGAQQKLVESLRQMVRELHADHALGDIAFDKSARSALDEMQAVVKELRENIDSSVVSLSKSQTTFESMAGDIQKGQRRFFPHDRLSEKGVAVFSVKDEGTYAASPSITRLDSGRLLSVLERSISWGTNEDVATKLVFASDNGGLTWAQVGTIHPMNWPQIFRCKSGVYVVGTERHFSQDNNLIISRMLDDTGATWSAPTKITSGWSVVSANTGVDVSGGRVTKTFEVIPSMAVPVTSSVLREDVTLPLRGGPRSHSWQHAPVLELPVASAAGFVPFTLVQVARAEPEGHPFFFRILEADAEAGVLTVRLERFNHYWARVPVLLAKGQNVTVGSGSNVYGGVDWVAMAMSGDEGADLTLPESWTMSTPLGNPASVYANEMRVLFDVAFRPDKGVRESIVGMKLDGIKDNEEAFEAGFGSLYWMEGVVTRLQDRHGGNGKLLSIMRVNNDLMCDLAALVEYDDSEPGRLRSRFLRYTNIPGLAVGHPSILYDAVSDLYWMATNANRDSVRAWKQPGKGTVLAPNLHITAFSKCEVDRSTLMLYYSPNLVDWTSAGVVDYHVKLGRHFAYPHMMVDGTDLVIVSRASFSPWSEDGSDALPQFFNNHNSNAISFHRIRHFRAYANAEWANEQGEYSGPERKSTNSVGSLVQTLLGDSKAGAVQQLGELHALLTAMSKLDDEMQHVQLVLNKRLEQCALKEESLSDLRRRQAQLESQSTVVDDALLEKFAAIEALEIQLLSAGVSVSE
ncbi:hypothetical protein F751_4982 [Auxenochlorella protothecoides]|uniref:Sialidase domain-containing protein n=1 Tax=Auxenochlorella protothecoides TaxID=3075 RepID=A0A087SMG7_AUXPR|nr:hypothetical protein F751_4982 [Auxenochlorella protothecoides]KFM26921.1 hypothetical protein F751_4982 [Auxenochlorella protothecoides]